MEGRKGEGLYEVNEDKGNIQQVQEQPRQVHNLSCF